MIDFDIEKLIPHRNRMKLVDRIVEIDAEKAVTISTVKERWPLFKDGCVNPMVLIEIAAQTAGVYVGWNERKKRNGKFSGKGWLVGIKKATFYLDRISLNTRIITSVVKRMDIDHYLQFWGTAKVDSDIIGDVGLQLFWIEGSATSQ